MSISILTLQRPVKSSFKQPAMQCGSFPDLKPSISRPFEATKETVIYTDGACLGNPGAGGYCAVVITLEGSKELCGGYRRTTNNRMELMAAIVGLENLGQRSG